MKSCLQFTYNRHCPAVFRYFLQLALNEISPSHFEVLRFIATEVYSCSSVASRCRCRIRSGSRRKTQPVLTHSIIPTLILLCRHAGSGSRAIKIYSLILSAVKFFSCSVAGRNTMVAVTWLGIALAVQTIRHWIAKSRYLMYEFLVRSDGKNRLDAESIVAESETGEFVLSVLSVQSNRGIS